LNDDEPFKSPAIIFAHTGEPSRNHFTTPGYRIQRNTLDGSAVAGRKKKPQYIKRFQMTIRVSKKNARWAQALLI
jgi:hypothetical protein